MSIPSCQNRGEHPAKPAERTQNQPSVLCAFHVRSNHGMSESMHVHMSLACAFATAVCLCQFDLPRIKLSLRRKRYLTQRCCFRNGSIFDLAGVFLWENAHDFLSSLHRNLRRAGSESRNMVIPMNESPLPCFAARYVG